MEEVWKEIPGYEGLYLVSNLGQVKSLKKSSKFHSPDEYILKSYNINSGYRIVELYDKNRHKRKISVHRLVAFAFLPNPNNLPCVNHKDCNKLNNCVDNLEWCTYKYNNSYKPTLIKIKKSKGRPVAQYDGDGFWVATYRSSADAARQLGVSSTSIRACCNGKYPQAHGYLWRYDTSISVKEKDITPPE